MLKVLFVGDVVGRPGRRALRLWIEENRDEFDICIANGENAAGGFGLFPAHNENARWADLNADATSYARLLVNVRDNFQTPILILKALTVL